MENNMQLSELNAKISELVTQKYKILKEIEDKWEQRIFISCTKCKQPFFEEDKGEKYGKFEERIWEAVKNHNC
ncbi:MAG: hypothetical protein MRERV_16c031 [Mycoplasmataceae bacterium RV_VA103A]|nr:MAG: hypothetical protein MRERV_16c031 [Mycoplasmataceae bacterium RV_VA103A]